MEFQDSQVMMCYKEQQYQSAIGKVWYYYFTSFLSLFA